MAKICMNEACQATSSFEWKKGWELKSGVAATLCFNCGSAYESSLYCQRFHLEESGWRECRLCGKRIHCGCIASKYLHDYLDYGGIGCITCIRNNGALLPGPIQIANGDISKGLSPLAGSISDLQSSAENRMHGINGDQGRLMQFSPNETTLDGVILNKEKLIQLKEAMNTKELSESAHVKMGSDANASIAQHRPEMMFPTQFGAGFPGLSQPVDLSIFGKSDICRPVEGGKVMHEPIVHPSLSFSLKPFPLGNRNSLGPSLGGVEAGREHNIVPTFQQDQRARQILQTPSKLGVTIALEANKELDSESRHFLPKPSKANHMSSEVNNGLDPEPRIARPPAEGRGRHQLLPRYWPRMTDQELQKISGDLNSKVVPLFEKVLSASDAGRIGRLVLPKACAEAYFPPIYQSDGVPIKIQDVKGREWTFQFRFWPNNNSRMYVLEGVTPCIQNMQLQAGDTVIFSRIDPGAKLVMGFRKSSNSVDVQDTQVSSLPNEAPPGETSRSGFNDNLSTVGSNEGSSQRIPAEKKNARNIGSKSKRLLMSNDEVKGLRLTWKEAQELLRVPSKAIPNIVNVEGTDIEEYDEPPVFGKKTIFTVGADGLPEQWSQCDDCLKWRKLPVDVLVPAKWTCVDNVWDSSRCSCAAPDEINPVEMDSLIGTAKDHKKRRVRDSSPKISQEDGPSGLDALATAAILGDSAAETSSVATTTRHPRHRPGCTCIVCIQPPSGKGKHKPSCVCVVCSTVKRRFKTLMMRKIRRNQAEDVAADSGNHKDDDSSPKANQESLLVEEERASQPPPLDLNINLNSEEAHAPPANKTSPAAAAMETADSRQNVLGDLRPCSLSRPVGERDRDAPPPDEGSVSSAVEQKDGNNNEG